MKYAVHNNFSCDYSGVRLLLGYKVRGKHMKTPFHQLESGLTTVFQQVGSTLLEYRECRQSFESTLLYTFIKEF